jgi:hypothetical protein
MVKVNIEKFQANINGVPKRSYHQHRGVSALADRGRTLNSKLKYLTSKL